MTAQGAAVLRFSGREIWRDAQTCAEEEALACATSLLGT